jgi:epoxide hydrolase
VTSLMAQRDAEHCAALHINFVPAPPPFGKGVVAALRTALVYALPSWFLCEREQKLMEQSRAFLLGETAYLHAQATKPHSLGVGMSDSPVGLAAWIVEKFHRWSDCHGEVESRFSKDQLLTNIMFYWLPNRITSSMRFYYEFFHSDTFAHIYELYVPVPTSCAIFPRELSSPPRLFAEYTWNVVRWIYMEAGGHFAATEEPELFAADLIAFVDCQLGNAGGDTCESSSSDLSAGDDDDLVEL